MVRLIPTAALSFLVLLAGCSILDAQEKEDPPEAPLTKQPGLLIGAWTWESSTYYFTPDGEPNTETPETAGYTEALRFLENGTVERYRDGELEERAAFEVGTRAYNNGTVSDTLLFIGDVKEAEFGVNEHRLLISTTFVDGPESIYRRTD